MSIVRLANAIWNRDVSVVMEGMIRRVGFNIAVEEVRRELGITTRGLPLAE